MNIDFDSFNFLYLILDKNGKISDINKYGCKLLGLPKNMILGKNIFNTFISEEDKDFLYILFHTAINERKKIIQKQGQIKLLNSKKECIYINLYCELFENSFVCFGFDITEKIKLEHLRDKIHKINKLIINSYKVNNICDYFLNETIKIIDGAEAGTIIMKTPDNLYRFVAAVNFDLEKLKSVTLTEDSLQLQKNVFIRKNIIKKYKNNKYLNIMIKYGKVKDIKSSLIIPIIIDDKFEGSISLDSFTRENAFDEDDFKLGEIISNELSQVIKRKKMEEKLRYMALHDQLTSLPNRLYFYDQAERLLKLAKRKKMNLAFVYIDLKHFKSINDNYGHDAGDYLLYEFAETLKKSSRESDFPARIGGDEFIVILFDVSRNDVINVIKRLKNKLNIPIIYENVKLKIDFNCGVAFFPKHGENVENLINFADKAMYNAKNSNKLMEFYEGE
ncbi:PAS domain S-box-containing protein/diguanylate cyclase (GGDEF) domain-containing protein [Marinitoga hydrogenitolerans DSM 16785]|uniref:PAS domain S-box-containing protein/diguanylate cyclase (GGDEF) domain-containing protein n=1 Tax=Marinitoga hydrogenitolerans (strain DSM 16785 / JCM 12826 / AT1271) TaxID=1122195 RepID=A0A1M4Z024_MARH1|nr:diguanylate cyclase [Marinitoga hydrogenitolerans]SHF11315.1 PAS domain S-box-containing protein/diguanylate cyclase (GGDEF) domain-containing protein [Marinitoga hydrogenitolerans DSM 16785]